MDKISSPDDNVDEADPLFPMRYGALQYFGIGRRDFVAAILLHAYAVKGENVGNDHLISESLKAADRFIELAEKN